MKKSVLNKRIRVSSCILGALEERNLERCVDTNWITIGPFVDEFESLFAQYCGMKYAVASCNGTAALHLALIGVGVSKGDEVIVPDISYVASANAVMYCGAVPVFCDILADTWCIDPALVERKITRKTKAIMAVHLYGHPCDMGALRVIAKKHGIAIVEDAAEAHGAEVEGVKVGALGDVASFSFFGNKMITTGEGGMCTANSKHIDQTMRLFRGQGVDSCKRYWHSVIGYNYRMTDLQAAVGCAQMKRLGKAIEHRRKIAGFYNDKLQGRGLILPVEKKWAKNVYWLYGVCIPNISYDRRDKIIEALDDVGVETRPVFYPIHQLPPYRSLGKDKDFAVACRVAKGGISLPCHSLVTDEDVEYVSDQLLAILAKMEIL